MAATQGDRNGRREKMKGEGIFVTREELKGCDGEELICFETAAWFTRTLSVLPMGHYHVPP